MHTIAILGAGRVGSTLGAGLAAAGHTIRFGVRNPEAARAKWTGPQVVFAGLAEAVRDASVVVNATPGDQSVDILSSIQAELRGKTLVDVANAMARNADGIPAGLLYEGSSLGEALQDALPETFVVKTLNTVLFVVMANPALLSTPGAVFLSGNSDEAKTLARGLLCDLGWPEQSVEDLGQIDSSRGVEALLLLVPYLIRSRGVTPFALTVAR